MKVSCIKNPTPKNSGLNLGLNLNFKYTHKKLLSMLKKKKQNSQNNAENLAFDINVIKSTEKNHKLNIPKQDKQNSKK